MKCPFCKAVWVSTDRSNPQLRYYFGVVLDMISEELGYELIEAHELMIAMFLKPTGRSSTRGMTTEEFVRYTETIKRWAVQELQINIPDPPNEKIN